MTDFDGLVRDLLGRSRISHLISPGSWEVVSRAFPGGSFERWIQVTSALADAGVGSGAISSFVQSSPAVAQLVGIDAALVVGTTARNVAAAAGGQAAAALLAASGRAAGYAADEAAFHAWLELVSNVAEQAPAAVMPLLHRTDVVLSVLGADALRSWGRTGLRLTAERGKEPGIAYFFLTDADSMRIFEHEAGNVVLGTVERQLRYYFSALWGLRPLIRSAGRQAAQKPVRRASFDGFMIRMPDHFAGFSGQQGRRLFHAALAHIGAHMAFTPQRFPVRSLKPLQVALVSLIEDARVEALADRRFPGLTRLWRSFHVAEAEGPPLAPPLMARLARALIDPAYEDSDPWVSKGRKMFNDRRDQWEDPAISREIGGLLGNDLGQMRVQFNPRTYTVEPAYRDDNLGIWDVNQPDAPSEEMDAVDIGVRISRTEQEPEPGQRSRTEHGDVGKMRGLKSNSMPEDAGIPIARYSEWDYVEGSERIDWVTVKEFEPRSAPVHIIDRLLSENADTLYRIQRLIKSARVSRPSRLRRQPEGDRLDLEASILATIDRRAGITPDTRVYEATELKYRDLSVLLLLDISESTKDTIRGTATSVLSVEIAATALVAEAMTGLGDPFAIGAFCSNGRQEVRYYRIKDFSAPYGERSKSRLAGLRGGLSTRVGAALRHAGQELARQQTFRRLLLIVTDGEPSDIDVSDRRYLVEDARKAVQSLAHEGIDVFCVGLDGGSAGYLTRIFGRRNVIQIDKINALTEKLPMLYLRLTA